jgi:hypothetical protein
VERFDTSVVSKKTMEQIGGAKKAKVWHSNRGAGVRAGMDDDDAPATRRRPKTVAEARAERARAARGSKTD